MLTYCVSIDNKAEAAMLSVSFAQEDLVSDTMNVLVLQGR
jgi:hypothetical protein